MVDQDRRDILAAGAAVAALMAAPEVMAQQAAPNPAIKFYERGRVRIAYQEVGSGFPLLLISGGGLDSNMTRLPGMPFNPLDFKDEFRCIFMDLRNAPGGQSVGPVEADRSWDSHADDQLGLMEHLGAAKFMVMGFCIGGPFIWNLVRRAPERVVAAVAAQPSGFRPEKPRNGYDTNMKGWGPTILKSRPDITADTVEKYLTDMYVTHGDFVYTATRDFVRACQTPVLVMPDDTDAHSYDVAVESAMLAPKGQMSMYPWNNTPQRAQIAARHARSFLKSHRPASA